MEAWRLSCKDAGWQLEAGLQGCRVVARGHCKDAGWDLGRDWKEWKNGRIGGNLTRSTLWKRSADFENFDNEKGFICVANTENMLCLYCMRAVCTGEDFELQKTRVWFCRSACCLHKTELLCNPYQ